MDRMRTQVCSRKPHALLLHATLCETSCVAVAFFVMQRAHVSSCICYELCVKYYLQLKVLMS